MKKITVFIENHNKILYLDTPIICPAGSKLFLKNATVYWKYDNVIQGKNDEIILSKTNPPKTKKITFEEGYWTFSMIKEQLSSDAVKMEATRFNNKCTIKSSTGSLNLSNFGPLLGFPKNTIITKGAWVPSPNVVNVNQDFKYINIGCNIINTLKNRNTSGNKSYTLAALPVTTNQALNGTSTFYRGINSEVEINGGCYNRLDFNVEANNDLPGACVDVLLELYIK